MSYINKKYKLFEEKPKYGLTPVRSEARIKRYSSATDARAWSDIVEERRQHILEYHALNKAGCIDKLIPLEILFEAMMANKNLQARKLRNRIQYLQKMLDVYGQLELTSDQKIALKRMRQKLDKEYKEMPPVQGQPSGETPYDRKRKSSSEEDGLLRDKPQRRKRKTGSKDEMEGEPLTSGPGEVGKGRKESDGQRDMREGRGSRGNQEGIGRGKVLNLRGVPSGRPPTGPEEIPHEEESRTSGKKKGKGGSKQKVAAGSRPGSGLDGGDEEVDTKPGGRRQAAADAEAKPGRAAGGKPGARSEDEERGPEPGTKKGAKPKDAAVGRPKDYVDGGASKPGKKIGVAAAGVKPREGEARRAGDRPGKRVDEDSDAQTDGKKPAATGVGAKPKGAAEGRPRTGPQGRVLTGESEDEEGEGKRKGKKGAATPKGAEGTGKEGRALAGGIGDEKEVGKPGGKKGAVADVKAKPKDAVAGRPGADRGGKPLAGEGEDDEDAVKPGGKKGAAASVGAKPKGAAGGRPESSPEGRALAESEDEEGGDKPGEKKKAAADARARPKVGVKGTPGAFREGQAIDRKGAYEEDAGIPGGKKGAVAGVTAKPKTAAGGRSGASPERSLAGISKDEEDAVKPGGKKGASAGVGAKPKGAGGGRSGTDLEGRPLVGADGIPEGETPDEGGGGKGAGAAVGVKPLAAPGRGPKVSEEAERSTKPSRGKGVETVPGGKPRDRDAGGRPRGGPEGTGLAGKGIDAEGEAEPGKKKAVGTGAEGRPGGPARGRPGASQGGAAGGLSEGQEVGPYDEGVKKLAEDATERPGLTGEPREEDGDTKGRKGPEGGAKKAGVPGKAEPGDKMGAKDGGRPTDLPQEGITTSPDEDDGVRTGEPIRKKPIPMVSDAPKDVKEHKERADLEKSIASEKDPRKREQLTKELQQRRGVSPTDLLGPREGPEDQARRSSDLRTVREKAKKGQEDKPVADILSDIKGDRMKERAFIAAEKDPAERERLRKQLERVKGEQPQETDGEIPEVIKEDKAKEKAQKPVRDIPEDIKGDKAKVKAYLEKKTAADLKKQLEKVEEEQAQEPAGGIPEDIKGDKAKEKAYLEKQMPAGRERLEKVKKDQAQEPDGDFPEAIKGDKAKEMAYLEKKMAAKKAPAEREWLERPIEKVKQEQAQEPAGDIPEDIKGDKAKQRAILGKEMEAGKAFVEQERSRQQLEKVKVEQVQEPAGDIPEDIGGVKAKERQKKVAAEKDSVERERLKKQLEKVEEEQAQELTEDIPEEIRGDKGEERAYLEKKMVAEKDPAERERLRKQLEKVRQEPTGDISEDMKDLGKQMAAGKYLTEEERLRKQLDKIKEEKAKEISDVPPGIKKEPAKEKAYFDKMLAGIKDPEEKERLRRSLEKQRGILSTTPVEKAKETISDIPDDIRGEEDEREKLRRLREKESGTTLETPEEKARGMIPGIHPSRQRIKDVLTEIPDDIKGDKEKERQRSKDQLDRQAMKDMLAEMPDDIRGDRSKEIAYLKSKLAGTKDPEERELLRRLLEEEEGFSGEVADEKLDELLSEIPDAVRGDKEKERAFLEGKLTEIKEPVGREHLRKSLEADTGLLLKPLPEYMEDLSQIPDHIKRDKEKERDFLESKLAAIEDPIQKELLKQQQMKDILADMPHEVKGDKEKERAFLGSRLSEIEDTDERERLRRLLDKETLDDIFADMPDYIKGDKAKEKAYLESMLANIKDPAERERLLKLLGEEMGIPSDVPDKKFEELLAGMPDDVREDKEKERAYLESKLAEIADTAERERVRKQLDKDRLKDLLSEMPDDIRGDKDKERDFLESMLDKIEDLEERERLRQLLDEQKMKDITSDIPDGIKGDPEKERAYLERKLAEIEDPIERERLRQLLELQRGISESPEEKLQKLLAEMPDDIKGDKAKEQAWLDSQLAGIKDPSERARLMKLFDAGEPGRKKPCKGVCMVGEPKLTPEELLQNILSEMPSDIRGDREKEREYFESSLAGITDPAERARLRKLFDERVAARKQPCKGTCSMGAASRPTPEELLQDIFSRMPPEIRGDEGQEAEYFENILSRIVDPYDREQLRKLIDESPLRRKEPCAGVCGPKQTPEDFLQSILSNMPEEIRGDRGREHDYVQDVLAGVADPLLKAQLSKLFDAEELERKIPCPGVCGINAADITTREESARLRSDLRLTPREIADPADKAQLRKMLDAQESQRRKPCAGVCGAGSEKGPKPEEILQNILLDMPNDIRGDTEQERTYFDTMISRISDPVEKEQLRNLFDAREPGRKLPCSAPCSMSADQRETPEQRAYFEGTASGIANQVERESLPNLAPCKSICAEESAVADKSLRKTSGVVALRDTMPGSCGSRSPRRICGATIKVEDRCAALIRQAQQRSAALAAASGGVVVLPKSSTRCASDLIPRGYLPGAALPEVIPPAYTQTVPPWLQQSNEIDHTCQASCSRYPTSRPMYLEHKKPSSDKGVSMSIETKDLIEQEAKSIETRSIGEDLVTNATETETDRASLKDAEEGTDTVRPQLEVAWKKEDYEASSASDFENIICKTVSARDLNIDLKELTKRGLEICKADCVSCDTAPKPIKTEEAVGSSSVDIRSQGAQSGRTSSESYATAAACSSGVPNVEGKQITDIPEPPSTSDEPTNEPMHPEAGHESPSSIGDKPEPKDEPPRGMDDESGQPLDGESKDESPSGIDDQDKEPKVEPLSNMDDKSELPLDEEPEVSEQASTVETTVHIVEKPIIEAIQEKTQEEQEIFADAEGAVLEEKQISDESDVEEHETKEDSQVYETADETDSVGTKKESEDRSVHFEDAGAEVLAVFSAEEVEEQQIIPSREKMLSIDQIPRVVSMNADQTITDVPLPSETRMRTEVQDTSTQISETISTPAQTAIGHPRAEASRLITYLESPHQTRRQLLSRHSDVDIVHKPIAQIHKTVVTDAPIQQHVAIDTNEEVIQVTEQGTDKDDVPKTFVCRAPCSNKSMLGKFVERICRGPCAISPEPADYKASDVKPKPPCRASCAAEAIQAATVCIAESIQTQFVCKAPCATQTLPCSSVPQACQSPICSGVSEEAQAAPQTSTSQVYQSESLTYTDATDAVAEFLPDDSSMGGYPTSCGCQSDLSESTSTPIKVSRTCQASCSFISRGNQMIVFKDQYSNVCSCSCQASCTSAERSTSPTTETGTYTTPQVCGARSADRTAHDKSNFGVGPSEPSKHVCAARRAQTGQVSSTQGPAARVSGVTASAQAQTARTSGAQSTDLLNPNRVCAANLSRERSNVCKVSRSPSSSRRKHVCSCKASTESGGAQCKLHPIKDNVVYMVKMPDPLKPLQKATVKKNDSEEKDTAKKLRKGKRHIKRRTCTCDCLKRSGKEECRCMESRYKDPKDGSKFIVGCNCKDCTCGCRDRGSNEDKDGPSDDNSGKKHRCRAKRNSGGTDDQEDLSILMIHKDAEIVALRNALRAKESYCAEQRKIAAAAIEQLENIKSIVEERDDLRKKLESSQSELEDLKKNVALGRPYGLDPQNEEKVYHVPFLDESISGSPVREEEIAQLEEEISNMRSGNLTPELEAKVIRKEVEVLKRYCSKLSVIQKESSHLKTELAKYKDQMAKLGLCGDTKEINDLRYKLSSLNDTIKERNDLKQRVKHLEKVLSQYTDLPEDVEVFKQRSLLLDEVLQDRDRLSRRVRNLRKKAARVDELEENLAMSNKQNKMLEDELEHVRCKCSYAEIDALNSKAEGDTLRSKLVCMEHEMETLKSQNKDRENLKQERDHLKKSLDELTRMQSDFEHMKHQMKSLEVLKAERDMFKSKYENLIGLECECDILRSQVERAKLIEKERDTLESQVEDLEMCISDQENEIRRLVCHIDALAQKDNQQDKLKDLIATMRGEMDTKSALLLASEEKLATMQCQFKTSFEDIRTETSQLRLQKEQLEKEIGMLKHRNAYLEQEVCCLKCANDMLMTKMEDTEEYIERLQRALKESDTEAQRSILAERYDKHDAIGTMRFELEAAKQENDRLQETINQMNSKVGDEHVQELLSQSRIAIERIALELNKQYEEWDCLKGKLVVEKKRMTCSAIGTDDTAQGPTGLDTNKQTKDVGIGERDPNLWYCKRKADDADNKPDGEASDDPSQWDCKRRTADEEGKPCEAPGIYASGADPSMWHCKQKADNPCDAFDPSGVDPSLWDCKQNAAGAPNDAPYPQAVDYDMQSGFAGLGAGGGPSGVPPCNCCQGQGGTKIARDSPGKKDDPNAPCTCLGVGELGQQKKPGECNCLKYFEAELKQPPECTCLKHFGEASDDPSKWDCRDKDKIKELEDRIAQLEKELAKANDTILKLQDRIGAADRTSAENLALRKHSAEVQDMAKDQIEELVEHLKKAKARVAELEDENGRLQKNLNDCLEEKKQLLARDEELQGLDKESMKAELESLKKEKDDMDQMIASTVVTASRRCSKLESQFDEVSAQNEQLKSEVGKLQSANQTLESENKNLAAKFASLNNENQRLNDELNAARAELGNLRKLTADPNLLEALRKENEDLKKQVNALLDQLKKPPVHVGIDADREIQESEALKAIIADLENQLKNLKKADVSIAPSDDLEKMIKELTRRLEEEQKRADAAEKALHNLKASDPSAFFNDEMKKLKERVAQLEAENADLRNALAKANSDVSNLQKELSSAKDVVNNMKGENAALKEAVTKAQAEASLAASAGGDGIEKLKSRIAQLENENSALKIDLSNSNADNKKMYDTINKLQNENAELKQSLAKLQNDNDKMRKDMDNMFNNAQKDVNKVLQLEKENDKLLQTIKVLESQIDKLKKDLDAALNQAKRESTGVSELQDELAELKQRIAQLEGENSKLKADLGIAMDNYKDTAAKLASYTDENEKLKRLLTDANKDIASLKKVDGGLKASGHEKCAADLARAENEIANLQKKIAQLENENARLKGELNTALDNLKKADDADMRQKLMMLENENSKLKSNLDAALKGGDQVGKFRQDIVKLEADNVKLAKDLGVAMDSLNKSNATISQLNNEIDKLKDKIKMLETENAKLKQDLNKALDDMKRAVAETAQARDDEAKLKQRIAQMEADNTNLKKDLDKAMANVKAMQQMREENEKLKNRVNTLETTNTDLKKDLDDSKKGAAVDDSNKLKDQMKMLENELSKLRDDHKKCPSLISQLNDEINNLKKNLSAMEKENVNLKTKYDGAAGDFKSTAAELSALKDNESKLMQLIGQLQDENKKLNAEIVALRAELKAEAGDAATLKYKDAKLNQRVSQLESENAKLKKDLDVALDQLKRVEKGFDQAKDDNAALKQRIAQLEAENASLKKNLDNAIAEAKKASAKEDDSKLRERLAQMEADNKKLKSDLNNALDEAKKGMADLSKVRDDDNKMKQRLASLENENTRLKKELEKALAEAQAGSSGAQQLKDETNKMKQKISQLESEIERLKKELNKALEDAKKGVSGISAMQDDDAKLKQRLAQLERENTKMRAELDAALKDASAGFDQASQLKSDNAKQKNRIAQLEDELGRLRKELENSLSDAKKGVSGLGDLQAENAKLKQRIAEVAEKRAKSDLSKMKDDEQKLKQNLAELESSNSKLKKDLDLAVGKSKAGMGDIEKTKDENAKMKLAMAQLEMDNAKLKKELDNALNSLKSTSSELQRLKDENAQLKQKIAQQEASNADMKKKLDSSLDDSKKSTGQAQDLLSEIQKLKQTLAERDKQLGQMKKDMEKHGGEAKEETAQLSQIVDENRKLNQRIKDLENQLQKCQDSLKTAQAEAQKNAAELVKIKGMETPLEKQFDKREGVGQKEDGGTGRRRDYQPEKKE
nr:unnamed protein product [Callosobruchus chinensis]